MYVCMCVCVGRVSDCWNVSACVSVGVWVCVSRKVRCSRVPKGSVVIYRLAEFLASKSFAPRKVVDILFRS